MQQNNQTKLLPCPFCGREADVVEDKRDFSLVFMVECSDSECLLVRNSFARYSDAVKWWNARAEIKVESPGWQIRPLRWKENMYTISDEFTAETSFGIYMVRRDSLLNTVASSHMSDWGWRFGAYGERGDVFWEQSDVYCSSADDGKEAAEKDWKARIESALYKAR